MIALLLAAALNTAPLSHEATLTKLAQALANGPGEENAHLYVGSLPPGTRLSIPLPNYPLLGSIVSSTVLGVDMRSTSLYFDAPASPGVWMRTVKR